MVGWTLPLFGSPEPMPSLRRGVYRNVMIGRIAASLCIGYINTLPRSCVDDNPLVRSVLGLSDDEGFFHPSWSTLTCPGPFVWWV